AEQLIDEGIFRAAERNAPEPAHADETLGIVTTGMRRCEHEGHGLAEGALNVKRVVEKRRQTDVDRITVAARNTCARLGHDHPIRSGPGQWTIKGQDRSSVTGAHYPAFTVWRLYGLVGNKSGDDGAYSSGRGRREPAQIPGPGAGAGGPRRERFRGRQRRL